MFFWGAFTYTGLPPDSQEMIAGFFVALIAAAVIYPVAFEKSGGGILNPRRWLLLAAYGPVFIREEIKSHWAVFKLVFTGKINPAIVKAPVKCKTALGRMMVANSITLTPGTFVLKEGHDCFYVHCLDYTPGPAITAPFDSRVGRIAE
jgi:multicomponent Na+:H+ antiporter subunit E